jgi:site-specific recombinase XerD
MLDEYFRDPRHLERLRGGLAGAFVEGFVERLEGLGRARKTVRDYLGSLSHFVLWLTLRGLTLASLDQIALEAFRRHAGACRCPGRKARKCVGLLAHVQQFLVHVRGVREGAVACQPLLWSRKRGHKARAKPEILQRFELWMTQERQVVAYTLEGYRGPLYRLVDKLGVDPAAYGVEALRGLIAAETRHCSPKTASNKRVAVGMFLRFLVSSGQTQADIEEQVLGPAGSRRARPQPWGLLGRFIQGFEQMLEATLRSPSTVRGHVSAVRRFDYWLSVQGLAFEHLDDAAVEAYREYLVTNRRAGHRFAFGIRPVRGLIAYLRAQGILPPAPPAPRPPVDPVLLRQFADWMMRHRGLCQVTVDIYARALRELLIELGEDIGRWEARRLRAFFLSYASRHGRTGARHGGTALRVFLRFLAAQGLCRPGLDGAIPPVAGWRLSSLPRYLEAAQVERVLAACDLTRPSGLRNRAILLLLARMGLRAGDVWLLRLADIDWRAGSLRFLGKGRRQTRLPLTQEVGDALLAYLEQGRPEVSSDRVFVRIKPPIAPFARSGAITDIVAWHIRRAGIETPHRGAHVLRHSAATEMLRQGASLDQIGAVLRHRSSETTLLYAKVDVRLLQLVAQPWPEEVSSC